MLNLAICMKLRGPCTPTHTYGAIICQIQPPDSASCSHCPWQHTPAPRNLDTQYIRIGPGTHMPNHAYMQV